jgi:hypothetical protein
MKVLTKKADREDPRGIISQSVATEMKEQPGQDQIDTEWKPKTWEQARAEAISQLQLSINRRIEDMGWTTVPNPNGYPGTIYNRDWKKDISRDKKRLAKMKRGEGENANGSDLMEARIPASDWGGPEHNAIGKAKKELKALKARKSPKDSAKIKSLERKIKEWTDDLNDDGLTESNSTPKQKTSAILEGLTVQDAK